MSAIVRFTQLFRSQPPSQTNPRITPTARLRFRSLPNRANWFSTVTALMMSLFITVVRWVADMERSLIWMESDVNGWACSNCPWRFPVPTLLSGEEAKGAYDRLAAAKFRQHTCEAATRFSAVMPAAKRDGDSAFTERARALIKRGFRPKVAVELALQEMEIEHGNNPKIMEKARADGEDFLQRVRKGLI